MPWQLQQRIAFSVKYATTSMYVWSCSLYHTFLFLTKHILVPHKSKHSNFEWFLGENPLWHGIPTISPTHSPQCIAGGKVQISKDSWCKDSSYRLEGLLIAFGGKGVQTNWSKCSTNRCFSKKTWDLGKRKGCERTKYITTWINMSRSYMILCQYYCNLPKNKPFLFISKGNAVAMCASHPQHGYHPTRTLPNAFP